MAEIPQNVVDFLQKADQVIGRFRAQEFNQFMWSECQTIESPIEQLFFIGLSMVAEMNFVNLDRVERFGDDNDALLVIPQYRADKYKVDFALRQHSVDLIVCVELDGHEFHDRNEQQRRYEKSRDRFLTISGHKVLHFTGSEIVRDPCAAALEAFALATGLRDVATNPFDEE